MAGGISTKGASTWLPALFGLGSAPSQYYVGLVSGEPRGADDGTTIFPMEPNGAGYGRQLYGTGPSWWTVDGTVVSNTTSIAFPVPTAPWGYLTHFVLCSAAHFGDLFAWGVLQNPQIVVQSVAPRLPAGQLVLGMQVSS